MKRRWWMLLASVAAKTQEDPKLSESVPIGTTPTCYSMKGMCKPANGQCPVCWRVAPKRYARETLVYECVAVSEGTFRCEPLYEKHRSDLIRCSHCSAAFYQDTEVPKP